MAVLEKIGEIHRVIPDDPKTPWGGIILTIFVLLMVASCFHH